MRTQRFLLSSVLPFASTVALFPSAQFHNNMKRSLPPVSVRQRGVALVIVLAFITLLAGLVVAYFSRSANDRQLSNGSFNQSKADELAKSAADIIVGDLKQEIVNGSTASTPSPSPASGTIYTPVA